MRFLVLPLAVLLLGALLLIVRGGDPERPAAAPEARTTAEPVIAPSDRADRACGNRRGPGGYLFRIETIGNVRCGEAKRVLRRYYEGKDGTGAWNCRGGDRVAICDRGPASKTIRARLRCRDWRRADRAYCLDSFGPP